MPEPSSEDRGVLAQVKSIAAVAGLLLVAGVLSCVDGILFIARLSEKPPSEEDRKRAAGNNPYHNGPFS